MAKRWLAALLALLLLGGAAGASGGVAGAEDMTDVIDIVPEGAEAVTARQLREGTWPVEVDVSSSMFKVTGCNLTVAGDGMTATLYMKSEAYSYMYPGAAEEAARAGEGEWTALETREDGRFAFTLPVDALDAACECAAYSARKELWYPRTLVFRADSLPLEAWRAEYLVTAETLGLADGAYTCAVLLEGAGRATLQTPARLIVAGGAVTARIVFSTQKIDYVLVEGERFEPVDTQEGAAFEVPVAAFGKRLTIVADSTAILPATEVRYTMRFDADTIRPAEEE